MKQMHFPFSTHRTAPWLVVLGVFLACGDLRAQTTNWIAPGSADWFTATNWDNGVPNLTSTPTATIANGGTANIDGSPAQAGALTIGTADDSSPGTLTITGGGSVEDLIALPCNRAAQSTFPARSPLLPLVWQLIPAAR